MQSAFHFKNRLAQSVNLHVAYCEFEAWSARFVRSVTIPEKAIRIA